MLAAPFEFGTRQDAPPRSGILLQGLSGAAAPLPVLPAQAAEVIKFDNDWGEASFAGDAASAALILDFSKVSTGLRFKIHADGSVDVTDGENVAAAAHVAKLIGGTGADTYSFERLLDDGFAIETRGGDDVLDLSNVTEDLKFTTHVDGSLSVSGSNGRITVTGAVSALQGKGNNTFVEEKAPVIAGTLNGGTFSADASRLSLAAFAATHAAPRELIIIDPSVANFESLLKGLVRAPAAAADVAAAAPPVLSGVTTVADPQVAGLMASPAEHSPAQVNTTVASPAKSDDALVLVLDANWDGVEQITQVLAAYQGLVAVQIVSHGSSGVLRLGNSTLSSSRLEALSDRLKSWKQSIVPGGDLLLYGCDVAAGDEGLRFIKDLSKLTGADVSASTNATGGVGAGGDWLLEASTGTIETTSFFAPGSFDNYDHLLASLTGVSGANDIFVIAQSSVTHQSKPEAAQPVATTETLTVDAGDGNDTFTVQSYSRASSTTINGGANTADGDKADLSGVSSNMNVVLAASGTQITVFDVAGGVAGANSGTARMTVNNVEEFIAGAGTNNTLNLSALTSEVLVRIVGKNKVEVSTGSGASWTKILEASNVHNVFGGNNKTHFVFFGAGSLDGFIDGRTSSGNVLSYSSDYSANGGTIDADAGTTGLTAYNKVVDVDLASDGSASSLKKGADGGFKNIHTFIGSNYSDSSAGTNRIDDSISGGANPDKLSGGAGQDLLEGKGGADVLVGGLGDDQYIYRAGADLVSDTITEAVGGGVDLLNFTLATEVLTVEFRPFTGAGVKVTAGASVLDNILNVEGVRGGTADSTYKFYDDWGRYTSTATEQNYSVKVENAVATNAKGTLDFSAVTRDLVFTLKANGAVDVVAEFTDGGTKFKYSVEATDIANIKGGKGNNTFKIESATALKGTVTVDTGVQASGKKNVLDYSGYSGDVFVDHDDGIATGIGTGLATQLVAASEVQRIVSTVSSGSFRLALAGLQTDEIEISSNVSITAANIQAALNGLLGAGATTVTGSGSSGTPWLVTFVPTVMGRVEFPLLTASGGAAASITITSQSHGQLPGGQNGISGIHDVVGGANKLYIVDGGGAHHADGSAERSVIVSGTANAAGDTLTGGAGADLIIGNNGGDTLHGEGGKDLIAGGDGADQIFGDAGDDKLAGGLGDDRLQGGAGDDILIDGSTGEDNELYGDTGNDTLIATGGTNSLVGGMGDDKFVVTNNWGIATVHDSEEAGKDTIDFSRVTESITHQFNGGVLVSGTGTFKSTTSYWNENITSTGDASGTFTGGSKLTVPLEDETNPTFSLDIAAPATSGNFTLTFGTAGATGNIAYNSDATKLAANIRTAIEAKFTGLKAQVKAGATANKFTIEITTQTDAFQESVKSLFKFVPATSGVLSGSAGVTLAMSDNGQALNEIQRLNLSGAPASIKIKLGEVLSAAIAIGADDAVNAAAIKTAINALNQYGGIGGTVLSTFGLKNYDVSVVVVGTKTYEVIFHTPNAANIAEMVVLDPAVTSTANPTGTPVTGAVTTLRDGRASSQLTNIETLVAADADNRFIFGNGWGTDVGSSRVDLQACKLEYSIVSPK